MQVPPVAVVGVAAQPQRRCAAARYWVGGPGHGRRGRGDTRVSVPHEALVRYSSPARLVSDTEMTSRLVHVPMVVYRALYTMGCWEDEASRLVHVV